MDHKAALAALSFIEKDNRWSFQKEEKPQYIAYYFQFQLIFNDHPSRSSQNQKEEKSPDPPLRPTNATDSARLRPKERQERPRAAIQWALPQYEIIIQIYRNPSEMSYAVTVKDQCCSSLEDSDDESLFCHRATSAREATSRRIWINKRLIGKRNRWTKAERQSYLTFLKEEFDLLQRCPKEQRKLRIYSLMEKYIGSKNYAQCRVHHQRTLRQFKNVERAIEGCERRLKGMFGRNGKMQQYMGLRVELESEEEGSRTTDENQIWEVLGHNCLSYYQKEEEEAVCPQF